MVPVSAVDGSFHIMTAHTHLHLCCPRTMSQALKKWNYDRFETYKKNDTAVAKRSLRPGTNGETASKAMLKIIKADKQQVSTLCNQRCVAMWLEAAEICELTLACRFNPTQRLLCHSARDIGEAWKQCAGPANCKKIAFIFDYYGTTVYQRAYSRTHQEVTADHIMKTMGIEMNVTAGDMRQGSKDCIQQQYSYCANNTKQNFLRAGRHKHHVSVHLGDNTTKDGTKNWKRPKKVYFNTRKDADGTVVQKVDYKDDDEWNRWSTAGVRKLCTTCEPTPVGMAQTGLILSQRKFQVKCGFQQATDEIENVLGLDDESPTTNWSQRENDTPSDQTGANLLQEPIHDLDEAYQSTPTTMVRTWPMFLVVSPPCVFVN